MPTTSTTTTEGGAPAAKRARTEPQPTVVGVAGCTASGKSTLCDAIVERCGGEGRAIVVSVDDFFLPDDHPQMPRLPEDCALPAAATHLPAHFTFRCAQGSRPTRPWPG